MQDLHLQNATEDIEINRNRIGTCANCPQSMGRKTQKAAQHNEEYYGVS